MHITTWDYTDHCWPVHLSVIPCLRVGVMYDAMANVGVGRYQDLGILIAGPEPNTLNQLRELLQERGFRNIAAVASAKRALELLGIDPTRTAVVGRTVVDHIDTFDLVVLDSSLADPDSLTVCQLIHDKLSPFIPVIQVTSQANADNLVQRCEAGADGVLYKPLNEAEVVAEVRMLLARKHKLNQVLHLNPQPPAACRIGMPQRFDLVDDYCLEDPICFGEHTVIYRARHLISDEIVVIKLLLPSHVEDLEQINRFVREVEFMTNCQHPHIVRAFLAGDHDGRPYYIMEFIDGGDLEKKIASEAPLPPSVAGPIACDIAEAIIHMHDCGIIHRDLKPKNFLLDRDDRAYLSDLGIAFRKTDPRLTSTFVCVGTPMYMAPEQFTGNPVDERADIYSFGASLYHMLTGRTPYQADCPNVVAQLHAVSVPQAMKEIVPQLDERWDDFVIRRCMAHRPAERPQTMREVRDLLCALLDS